MNKQKPPLFLFSTFFILPFLMGKIIFMAMLFRCGIHLKHFIFMTLFIAKIYIYPLDYKYITNGESKI